jgi:hypothetical protein
MKGEASLYQYEVEHQHPSTSRISLLHVSFPHPLPLFPIPQHPVQQDSPKLALPGTPRTPAHSITPP